MKKLLFLQTVICLLVMSCTVQEPDMKSFVSPKDKVFFASLESYNEPGTRVFVDNKIKLHWDADDRISIFNQNTYNQEYRFTGITGDRDGNFKLVDDGSFVTGNPLTYICAVYPYWASTKINNNNVMTLTLPGEQVYREDSFGAGANLMISCTKSNPLEFKNACGYLVLKFYGKGVSVSSIRLEGNGGELLSGNATWTPVVGEVPTIKMDPNAEKSGDNSVTLACEKPVELNTAKEDATLFWIVVPPTDFAKGFTLTVTNTDGKTFVKKTDKQLSIVRNTLLRIAPIEVAF